MSIKSPPTSELLNVQEGIPLEDDLVTLMGQEPLHIAEGSLYLVGQETINGIPCKKYTVDSTYYYTATFPTLANLPGKVTYRGQGEIWVADHAGWPSFVVQARLSEVVITETAGRTQTETFFITQEVTDINSPDVQIEPPKP